MEVSELRSWAKRMGYPGEIPNDFELLNESTSHIWKQVVERVRPKHEVEQIHRNILIRQLQTKKNLEKQPVTVSSDVLDCASKEYNVWERKQQLKKNIKDEKLRFIEANEEIKKIQGQNNLILLKIEGIDAKVKECEQKEYLYHKKQENLMQNIKFVEKKIQYIDEAINCIDANRKSAGLALQVEKIAKNLKIQDGGEIEQKISEKNKIISELYRKNGRNHLVGVIGGKKVVIKSEIKEIIKEDNAVTQDIQKEFTKLQEINLSKLYALHIEKTLETIKLHKYFELKHEEFRRKEFELIDKFDKYNPDVNLLIGHELKQVEDETLENFYCKSEMKIKNDTKHLLTSSDQRSRHQAKKNLVNKKKSLLLKLDTYMQLERCILHQHQSSKDKFVSTKDYSFLAGILSTSLSKPTALEEIETVMVFNLEFNRKTTYSNCGKAVGIYYRDTCNSPLPFITSDDELLRTLVLSLGWGLSATRSETILRFYGNKMAEHVKFMEYSARVGFGFDFDFRGNKKFNLKDLRTSSELMKPVVDALEALTTCGSTPTMSLLRRSLNLWEEMPFARYVPPSVLYKGENYEYYEDQYEEYFRCLREDENHH